MANKSILAAFERMWQHILDKISNKAEVIKLTQAEYDDLPDSKYTDGIVYAITDGESSSSGGTSKPVELTKAQYEALGDSVLTDGILYAITDGDELSAKNLAFDDTETQLGVNNVQDAIVEQNKKFANGFKWNLIGTEIGEYEFTKYNEIIIVLQDTANLLNYSIHVPIATLTDTDKIFRHGHYFSSSHYAQAFVTISKTRITAANINFKGSSTNTASIIEIYAR